MSDPYSVDVRVTAPVNPTEVPDRVARAVTTLFPDAEVEGGPDRVVARGHSLERFSERLHEQQILDAARAHLRGRVDGDRIEFRLKKQAAFVGVVNFAVGNPDELGDVTVTVTVHRPTPAALLDIVAPETDAEGTPMGTDTGG